MDRPSSYASSSRESARNGAESAACTEDLYVPVDDGPRPQPQGWTYEGKVSIGGIEYWHFTMDC